MEFPGLSPYAQYRKNTRKHREWIVRTTTAMHQFEGSVRRPNHHTLFRLNDGFPYPAIDASHEIRILELAPSVDDGPLMARLVTATLQAPGHYDALSHHWDHRLSTDQIIFPDGSFRVSQSIAQALRHLRCTHSTRRLWVDSICINQIAKKEKVSQVKIMGEIYSKAASTRVWLGEARRSTGTAFSTIERLASTVDVPAKDLNSREWWAQSRENGVFDLSDAEREALNSLIRRGWFDRTWILQEVALAQAVVVQCGQYTCDWKLLERMVYIIHYRIGFLALGLRPLIRLASVAETIRPLKEKSQSLWDLLESTCTHETSNPLDKVYALLGLASDAQDFQHLVDYRMSPEVLYFKIFQHYLSAGRPGILNLAGNAAWRFHASMPSWAPDWCMSNGSASFFKSGLNHEPFALDGLPPMTSEDGRVLRIRGFVVDQVSFIRGSAISIYHRTSCRYLSRWEKVALEREHYPTGQLSIDAFIQTLVAGMPMDMSLFENGHDFVRALYVWLRENSISKKHSEWSNRDVALYLYWLAMASICHNKTFFKTHAGYIGLGSFFLRPGDLIVELHNGTTPFAIRPAADGCYTLVGDAYLHGFMEGPVVTAGRKILDFALV
jgi:hypothetical protein